MSSSDSWTDPGEGDKPSADQDHDHDHDHAVEAGDGPAANDPVTNDPVNGALDDMALRAEPTDEHPVVQPDWVDDGLVPDTPAEVLGLDGALHTWPAAEGHEMTATAKLQQAIAEHIAVFTEDEVDDSWVEWPTIDDAPATLPRFGGNGNGHGSGNGNGHGGGAITRPPQPPFNEPVASASADQPTHGPGSEPVAGHEPGTGWDGATHQTHEAQPPSQVQPPAPPPSPPHQAPPSAAPSPYDQPADGPMPVDQVAVRKLGGFNFLSVSQWAVLPRDERARLIKSESVIFLNEGENVPLRSALLFFKGLNSDQGDGGGRRRR